MHMNAHILMQTYLRFSSIRYHVVSVKLELNFLKFKLLLGKQDCSSYLP